nr:hypothetical protein [Tanacetum cinerariifolium]
TLVNGRLLKVTAAKQSKELASPKQMDLDKIAKLEERVHKLEEENRILKEKSFTSTKSDIAAPIEDKEESFKQGRMITDIDEDVKDTDEEEPAEVEKVLEVVTTAKLMTEVLTTAQPTTTVAQVPKASAPRIRMGVIIQEPEETTASVIAHTEVQPKSKDKGKGILIKEPKPLKRQAQIKQDEAFARQLEVELNANINWNDVIDKQGESIEQEIAKKQRMGEEAEELKRHLQIVANDDDDVYTKATPLASKVPIVDYQSHHENNKPYYKIIKADGTHKLFLSFITLLKNFDKEDLKTLWKLVKERFETTEPKNFLDDFLLNIFKIKIYKPNVEANVCKDQKGRYRLEVEEESEMSLELLRLVKRQLNEGYVPE